MYAMSQTGTQGSEVIEYRSVIYTDGCCKRRYDRDTLEITTPGGWAAIIKRDGVITFIGGYLIKTTNNEMELLAIVKGLEATPNGDKVLVVSDSMYAVDGINSWMHRWVKKDWMLKKAKKVKNLGPWKRIYQSYHRTELKAKWVKGHSGNQLNDLCDKIANYCCLNRVEVYASIEDNPITLLDTKIENIVKNDNTKRIQQAEVESEDFCLRATEDSFKLANDFDGAGWNNECNWRVYP